METILGVLSTVFWGLVLLSALVFLHEGGHFLAARACGVRVTEYFLGLPCRINLSHRSKRIGTRFGITPILLGGYAMICGMDPTSSTYAAPALTLIHRRGSVSCAEIAHELGCTEEDALEACALLADWGSVVPVYDIETGENPNGSTCASTYAAAPRDARGFTIYDGRAFDRSHATEEGESWEPTMGEQEFFEQERSRTYLGKGFWKRSFMLLAGIIVNLASGLLLLMCIYSVVGIEISMDVNTIGSVEESSSAQEIGLEPGDAITSVAGVTTDTWTELVSAIQDAAGNGPFEIVFEHDGEVRTATVELSDGELLGIGVSSEVVRMNIADSARLSIGYIVQTAQSIAQLVNPAHTVEVLESSTSVVGISVMSAQAAAAGPVTFLSLAALISFSLGLMNLLPIPPLDGGKFIIEIVQAVIRRPLPIKVQSAISYVGIALFVLMFVFVLRNDIIRFIL